jgi:hypothetical protein
MIRVAARIFTAALAFAILGAPAWGAEKALPIPAGSTLRMRLDTLLSDKTNKSGDPFTGVVMEPITVDGVDVIPKYSAVKGHVAFSKPSGRIRGAAELRIVIDSVTTDDNVVYPLSGSLEDSAGNDCNKANEAGKNKPDDEGTLTGCGKSKKDALKSAAILGGIGAAGGATVGVMSRGGCDYYGNCYPSSGPGLGADIGIGAGVGVGTALVYSLLKHEKHIVLAPGIELRFTVNRTTTADATPAPPSGPGQ